MSDRVVCKPTPWFFLRAAAMIVMFGVFAVLFYKDGKSGYREANLSYFLSESFKKAAEEFTAKGASMSPEEWAAYASTQEVAVPENPELLPVGTEFPIMWPEMLHDHAAMAEKGVSNPKSYFDAYRQESGLAKSPPEQSYTQQKINEQWYVFWICLGLLAVAIFFLLRTLTRKMVVEGDTFQPAGGKAVPIKDLVRLDLRKWSSKGLAMAWANDGSGGERKIRIDGLTYGGFKAEDGEPAEKLMQALKSRFSGEIIEYETDEDESEEALPADASEARD
ncbi:hypothetical protein ACFQY0_07875 [Haloferula chungangensis]|uniref:DUF3592 domain-containing protein n=1 Tax=Haloferula chungangensis TaxID=1048331 RepID=A0ABW2L6B6_9BACT